MTAIKEPKTKFDALAFVLESVSGYLDHRLDGTWGENGTRGRGLRFRPGARTRLGQVFGWIAGLASHKKELAEKLARDICGHLDWLANYGGLANDQKFAPPKFLVELGDDGTFNGFTVLWYAARTKAELVPGKPPFEWEGSVVKLPHHARYNEAIESYQYVYYMNGGLLYHGPGGQEVFAVNLGSSSLWGIHT